MEPNPRDTQSRRCSTTAWGVGLMLAAFIVSIILCPLFQSETSNLVDQEQQFGQVLSVVKEVHITQEKVSESYNYDSEIAAKSLLEKVKK